MKWIAVASAFAMAATSPVAAEKFPAPGAPFTIPVIDLEMRPIPTGSFLMGSPLDEPGRVAAEAAPTRVVITQSFWMGRCEITHGQWQVIMGGDLLAQVRKALADDTPYRFGSNFQTLRDRWKMKADDDPNPKIYGLSDDQPMHYVNWREAMEFCQRLTQRERAAGRLRDGLIYSLPTEAQWEYACRAGTSEATYAGAMTIVGRNNAPVLDAIAWYGGNSSVGYEGRGFDTAALKDKQFPGGMAGPRAVGTRKPNAWGLYDMLGNVWEWCRDEVDQKADAVPTGSASEPQRVERGASWLSYAAEVRAASRFVDPPGIRVANLGFRIVLVDGTTP